MANKRFLANAQKNNVYFALVVSRTVSLIFFCLLFSRASAQERSPTFKIKTAGVVTDLILHNSVAILSTDAGTVETYDLQSGKKTDLVQLPKMKDFMGDDVPTKVFSIDEVKGKIVAVTQGEHGFRNVLILEDGDEKVILSAADDKLMIKKVRWLDETRLLLGLMSNELLIYDLSTNQFTCTLSISPYTFSDYSLTENNQEVFTADESGIVHQIDLNKCELKRDFTGINVDNIYQIVFNSGAVITAGQDRRVGIYNTISNDHYYLQKDFLVYAVGLSPDGTIGAYSATEENEISVFDVTSQEEMCILKGHESVVTKLYFINNNNLISAGDDHHLMIWRIK